MPAAGRAETQGSEWIDMQFLREIPISETTVKLLAYRHIHPAAMQRLPRVDLYDDTIMMYKLWKQASSVLEQVYHETLSRLL